MISSMYVPICKRFHAKQDNSGKITTFYRVTPPDTRMHAQASLNIGGWDLDY